MPMQAISAGRGGNFSPTLKRNCSISPAGLLCVFVALGSVSLAIGIGFAMLGAWLILPFAGLEVVALGAAFVVHARRVAKELGAGGAQR
jgi:uncharacterized membrane protein